MTGDNNTQPGAILPEKSRKAGLQLLENFVELAKG